MMNICDRPKEYDNFELKNDSNQNILLIERNNSEPLKVNYLFFYIGKYDNFTEHSEERENFNSKQKRNTNIVSWQKESDTKSSTQFLVSDR